ncbi:hypothetical protein [Clostridium saccharobutylicum]|uniref:Uncharacterized protein n=2 Tax=Clostridium saccharobutylicum TaxID=169679 RepID=A0A1S8MYK2_CLOSA|nr:hypothetical protein [Clostridium saccharobutylicum]OOM09278.1 hypothetical protein CLOSAC_35590 [Clostridium saccharobutylicum]
MKKSTRIICLTVIGLLIQQAVFLFVEKVYMATDININILKEDDSQDSKNEAKEFNLKDNVDEVKVSSNGRYAAYLINNKLKVLDSRENTAKTIDSDGEMVFYKWVTNSDRIIGVQKIKENGKYYFQPVAFDAKNAQKIDLADFDLKELKIQLSNNDDKIDNVVFSVGTHSLYIKVKKNNGKCDLYRANTMNQLEKVRSDKDIGDILVPTTGANAIMEMGSNVTILNSTGNLAVSKFSQPKVLGTDVNDNVYFGDEVNGKIDKIAYAVASDKYKEWKTISIKTPVEKSNISVDFSGKIYINNEGENNVLELTTNKTIKYEGKFVQSYSNGVISRVKNKLIKNPLQ